MGFFLLHFMELGVFHAIVRELGVFDAIVWEMGIFCYYMEIGFISHNCTKNSEEQNVSVFPEKNKNYQL